MWIGNMDLSMTKGLGGRQRCKKVNSMMEEEGRKPGNLSSDFWGAATLDRRRKMKEEIEK